MFFFFAVFPDLVALVDLVGVDDVIRPFAFQIIAQACYAWRSSW